MARCAACPVWRRNAVDKVVGWALRQDLLPLSEAILYVSSRASFELTRSAMLAGIGVLVAVSAPTSLSTSWPSRRGTRPSSAYARGDSMNRYTHPERVRLAGAE